ncbi:MAG: hypothetical protein J6R30_09370 [Bacteroidales bacterium]|nr:hypothetical protein [Bacteroidales bacterium]
MEYNINTEQSILGTKIEITSESNTEYVINVINQTLTESQIKAIVKSVVEIVEGVFLS